MELTRIHWPQAWEASTQRQLLSDDLAVTNRNIALRQEHQLSSGDIHISIHVGAALGKEPQEHSKQRHSRNAAQTLIHSLRILQLSPHSLSWLHLPSLPAPPSLPRLLPQVAADKEFLQSLQALPPVPLLIDAPGLLHACPVKRLLPFNTPAGHAHKQPTA